MILNAEVLSADVDESTFYDSMTGAQKPGWVVNMTVLDVDTDEKYEIQITEGFPLLDELKERKRMGDSSEALREIAEQLRAQLPGRHVPLQLEVLRFKGKQVTFLKLVCRLVGVAAAA